MSMGTFDRLIEGLRPASSLKTVAFWGIGEPLLHPSIVPMIRRVKELGAQAELITNGLLLDGTISRNLVDAGLDVLIVSLDAGSQAAYGDLRPGADLEAVRVNVQGLQAIKGDLSTTRPEVGIEFVVMRRNLPELRKLASLADRLEARFVIVSNLLPHSGELKEEILYWISAGYIHTPGPPGSRTGVLLPPIDARPEYLPNLDVTGARQYGVRQDRMSWPAVGGYCPFVENGSIAVSWNGAVSPCVPLMHSHRCFVLGREKQLRQYTLGNVREVSVREIWESAEFRAFQLRVLSFDFPPCIDCGGCDMVGSNDEDCFGNPHPTCGDCLWSRGIVLCP